MALTLLTMALTPELDSGLAVAQAREADTIPTPQDFGARCDGTSDDTQSFADALAATRRLFIPPGTCRVATIDLPSGAVLSGVPGRSVVQMAPGSTANLLTVRSANHARIEGVTWDAHGQTLSGEARALIFIGRSRGVTFVDNVVQGGTGAATGVVVFQSSARIDANDISGFGDQLRIDSTRPVSVTHNRLHDNATDGASGGNGITIEHSQPGPSPTVIDGNWLANHSAVPGSDGPSGNSINGFRVDGVRLANNYATDPEFSCYRFNASDNLTATGNQCYNAGETGAYSEFSSVHNQWINNYFENSAVNCLNLTNFSSTPRGQMHSAIGNHMQGCGRAGIQAEGRTIVSGNTINHATYGVLMGFGGTGRDVLAEDNLLTDTAATPIMRVGIAVEPGEGGFVVAGNAVVRSASLLVPISGTDLSVSNELRPLRPEVTIRDQRLTFNNLGNPAPGSSVYCPDCAIGEQGECRGGGRGAFAKRLPATWICD